MSSHRYDCAGEDLPNRRLEGLNLPQTAPNRRFCPKAGYAVFPCFDQSSPVLHAAIYPSPASEALPLVILHGFLGASGNWHTLARRWAETRPMLVPDARNHGRSFHADAFGYAEMTDDLAALLDDRHVERVDLLGHSMGGKTAMRFAVEHPHRVRRLVVADISPFASPAQFAPYLDAMAAVDLAAVTDRDAVEAALRQAVPDWGVRQFLLKNLSRTREGFRWTINLPVLRAAWQDVGKAVDLHGTFDGPTLFVRGERSGYVTDADWPLVQTRFPHAELATVPKAGHWLHADQPEAFFEIVEAFLAAP